MQKITATEVSECFNKELRRNKESSAALIEAKSTLADKIMQQTKVDGRKGYTIYTLAKCLLTISALKVHSTKTTLPAKLVQELLKEHAFLTDDRIAMEKGLWTTTKIKEIARPEKMSENFLEKLKQKYLTTFSHLFEDKEKKHDFEKIVSETGSNLEAVYSSHVKKNLSRLKIE